MTPTTLSNDQLRVCAEITGELYPFVEYNTAFLNAAEETAIQADVTLWNASRNDHLKIKGGSEGVDIDPDRTRAAITRRVRRMFRFPDTSGCSVQIVRG